MAIQPGSDLFKTTPPRAADKADTTTKAAREIIGQEAAAMAAKTARLRAARLAKEAEDAAAAETALPPSPKKRAARR